MLVASGPYYIILYILYKLYIYTGEATLVFEVEMLDIKKPPMLRVPQGGGFWTILGVVLLLVMAGYELHRRANKQSEEAKKAKKNRDHPATKKVHSKKRK